jgi:hypothetical protein
MAIKTFLEKHFHGVVKVFNTLQLRGGGTFDVVNKENPDKALFDVRRYGANWWGCYEGINYISDLFVDGSKAPLAGIMSLWVDLTTPVTFSGGQWQAFRASIIAGSTSTMTSADFASFQANFQTRNGNTATIPNAYGVESRFASSGTAGGTVTNFVGFLSTNIAYGTTVVTNYYSFYSKFPMNSKITNEWHFYGEGDYPSFFGGDIIQIVRDTNVSNPPTKSELNTAFPNAVEGQTVYIDDNNAHSNFYQCVKVDDGTDDWFIFTGTKAT